MKRFSAFVLACLMMIQLAVAAVAVEPEDVRVRVDEAAPCTSQRDGLWTLLSRKWLGQNSATLFASGPGLIYSYLGHTMPTTGDVRPLVLPIDFPDMKMTESEHERLVRNLYAENDPEKSTYISSAKAQLYRHSYGKLNLVGDPDKDILPIYTAPENRDYYLYENSSKLKVKPDKWLPLLNTALASYFDNDPERDYADYDADGDGCIDALIIWSATHTNAFFDPVLGPESGIKINDLNVKSFNRIEIGPWMMGGNIIAHELGHAMGLDEAYEKIWCEIPGALSDLMGTSSCGRHLNAYSRYILNWVDPLVITASDPVQSIDLYSADWYGGEFDDSKPRAIVLIPENKDLPLTEFYMVEYRPNEATRLGDVDETYPTLGERFPNQPGVLIWHCDAEWDFDYYQFFVRQDRYRLPVYRSGNNSNTSFFSYEDFYTTGTVFSPETTPNSAFYDGTDTGIYVEVVQADGGEYATLNVGFLDVLPPEVGGEGVITASDVTTDSAALSWTAAQDKQTGTDDLTYTLYRSDSDELDTVEQCEVATLMDAGAGLTTSTVTGLEAGSTYYFNVVVEDQAGNKATYEKVAVATHAHDYGGVWQHDPAGHWHECVCGDRTDYAAHSGGTATCAQKAACEVCGQPYGEADADNHRYDYTQAPAWSWTGTTAATATWTCGNDAGHTDVRDAEISSAVTTPQSCTDDEMTTYTASVTVGGKTYTDSLPPVKTQEKLGHDWLEATCTEPKTCSRCQVSEGEALGHDWQDATCTTPKICSRCSATEGEALGHDWQDATCTEPKTCSRCHATEGEALGHNWQAATCITPKTCARCNTTEGEALGHDFAENWSKDGTNHWHDCSRCDVVSDSDAHSWDAGEVTTPATCEGIGVMTYTCAVCDQTKTGEIETLGHDWQNATCTEPKTCSRCHTTEDAALGHVWSGWIITDQPTIALSGAAERVCARDDSHKDVVILPELTDNAIWTLGDSTEPTEEDDGFQVYISEYGNVTLILPALGHTHHYGTDWVSGSAGHWHECVCGDRADYAAHSGGTATCAQKAVCEVCGQPYGEVDADHHSYDYTQAPVWSWIGTTAAAATWTCGNDADHTDVHDAEISSAVTTSRSCTDNEMTTYTASVTVGGKTYTDSLPPVKTREKLGHTWSEATCTIPKTCSRCHATEGEALGHDWGDWVTAEPATATAEGRKERICARCSVTETQGIPPLGFDFSVIAWQFRDANGTACDAPVDGGVLAAATIERAESAPEALVIIAVYSGDAMTGVKILSLIKEENPVELPMDRGDTARIFILHPRTLVPFEVAGSTIWPR